MKTFCLHYGSAALLILLAACSGSPGGKAGSQQPGSTENQGMSTMQVTITPNEAARQIDVAVGGQPFTSYCYWEKLRKPVLYPLRTDDERVVTRGYPYEKVPGERADHPHQFSSWFTYGNVNGNDFWGSSAISNPNGKVHIAHRSVSNITNGTGSAHMDVTMDWIGKDDQKLLEENDRIYFRAGEGLRIIDRVIRLTAQDKEVSFPDTKEGMFGIRVTRTLEEPMEGTAEFTDASGGVTKVEKMDNTGVNGEYLTSEGSVGEAQGWGTSAKWCILRGMVAQKPATIAIFDHPDNVGYPTHWHIRGYGLFSANPLGLKDFTKGQTELNFLLAPGASTTFRYRILVASRRLEKEETERLYATWLKEIAE